MVFSIGGVFLGVEEHLMDGSLLRNYLKQYIKSWRKSSISAPLEDKTYLAARQNVKLSKNEAGISETN